MDGARQHGRIAALDVGDKRIGVAVTDPLGYTAQPLMTIATQTPRTDIRSIARLFRKHAVAEAVVGRPLHMSGEAGKRARKAEEFAEALRLETGLPVHLIDERLTTWEAHQILDGAGGGQRGAWPGGAKARQARQARQARESVIDQIAAVLILEAFLQQRAQDCERTRTAEPDASQ